MSSYMQLQVRVGPLKGWITENMLDLATPRLDHQETETGPNKSPGIIQHLRVGHLPN